MLPLCRTARVVTASLLRVLKSGEPGYNGALALAPTGWTALDGFYDIWRVRCSPPRPQTRENIAVLTAPGRRRQDMPVRP
ncbi:hypothetical protein GCM10010339_95060 [Streptomyces alanosinicus]|uniref:Uncharacterized protein n=1 Tax=Streptomyces alanosinicus TaxID=68171 RepID=A0A918IPR3_9ACTN|nr:hypothetical protein GCM10010339_95060 [Streptomyces alanosinicus]